MFYAYVKFDKGAQIFLISHVMSKQPYEEHSINRGLNTGVQKLLDE